MPITSFGARATRSPGGSSWPTWRTTPGPHGRCCVPTGSSRIRPSLEFTPLPGSGLFLIIVIFRHDLRIGTTDSTFPDIAIIWSCCYLGAVIREFDEITVWVHFP